MECVRCQADDKEIRLNKCPMCFKLVCDECAHRSMGRAFCTKRCADEFFFGDEEDY